MDDDDFGDEDWIELPDNALQQLEQSAITSTQRGSTAPPRAAPKPAIQTYGTTGLTARSSSRNSGWRPPRPQKHIQQNPVRDPDLPSSDYGFDDEDVIDLDQPSLVIPSASILPTRGVTEPPVPMPAQSTRWGSKAPIDPDTEAAFAAADAELGNGDGTHGEWAHAPHLQPKPAEDVDILAMQSRIAELEAQQARLVQSEHEARRAAEVKQGEIAIVRSNQEKASKEYERRISVMQKLHIDETSKQKAELEAGRKERDKMETHNRFLQHDLAQEAERAKRTAVSGKGKAGPGETSTPRKLKRTAMGDGFEDDEVQIISPSRSKDKSREQTPKVGLKRKRLAQDSPIAPLSFSKPPRKESTQESLPTTVTTKHSEELNRYMFMQRLLNHRPQEEHERSLEALTKYTFPSHGKESLSALVLAALTSPLGVDDTNMSLKLSRIILNLWRRCVTEQYYKPVYLLLDLIRFALEHEVAATVVQILQDAVYLCVKSISLAMEGVFSLGSYSEFASAEEHASFQANVEPYVDVDEMLDFLKQLCNAASLSSETAALFWRTVSPNSLLLMINKAQSIERSTVVLDMLQTSFTPNSIGCTAESNLDGVPQTQTQREKVLIDRLINMIVDVPQPPKDEPPYIEEEILEFRLEILSTLKRLCQYEHGGIQLAQHRFVIARLIRFLDLQVCKLYTTRPAIGLVTPPDEKPAHTLIAENINATVRLIYHLLRAHSDVINLQQKLSVFRGGWHKFLISMTRIAFSDRLVFEKGLDDACVEAAHQILDSVLSPEEGEAVMKAVETPRGTKGTSTEKDSESEGGDAMEEEPD